MRHISVTQHRIADIDLGIDPGRGEIPQRQQQVHACLGLTLFDPEPGKPLAQSGRHRTIQQVALQVAEGTPCRTADRELTRGEVGQRDFHIGHAQAPHPAGMQHRTQALILELHGGLDRLSGRPPASVVERHILDRIGHPEQAFVIAVRKPLQRTVDDRFHVARRAADQGAVQPGDDPGRHDSGRQIGRCTGQIDLVHPRFQVDDSRVFPGCKPQPESQLQIQIGTGCIEFVTDHREPVATVAPDHQPAQPGQRQR